MISRTRKERMERLAGDIQRTAPRARAGSPRHRRRVLDTGFQPVRAARRVAGFALCQWLLFCLIATGCNALPAGDPGALQLLRASSTTQPASAPIILIRGWRDLWSDGIDELAGKLQATGHPTAVFKESQWRQVEAALRDRSKSAPLPSPVVLIGFSWGADDVVLISRNLAATNRPVDLLILIDPVTPSEIPHNVRRCINFYQSNGVMDVFPWLRGVPVAAQKGERTAVVENIDLRDRPDLLEANTSHKTIAGNAKVHEAILAILRSER